MAPRPLAQRLHRWLFAYTVIVMLLLGVAISAATIWPLYRRLKAAEESYLVQAATTRAVAVSQWLRRARDLARQITSRTKIRHKLQDYNAGRVSLAELQTYTEPKLADAMERSEEVVGVTRLDARGRPVAHCGRPIPRRWWPPPGRDPQAVVVGEPFWQHGALHLVVRAPIRDRQGRLVGTDLVLLHSEGLRRLVSDRTGLGRSGRVVLGYLRGAKVYSLFPGQRPGPPREITGPLAQVVRNGRRLTYLDDTILARVPVPDSQWVVVVAMDRAELYGPVVRRLVHTLVLAAVFTAASLVGLWLLLRPLASRMLVHATELEEEIRQHRRTQAELNRLNQRLAAAHQQRKELSRRLIEFMEALRSEVARDLHDHTGQLLTTLRLDLERAASELARDPAAARRSLDQAMERLGQVQRSVKHLARGLSPSTLDYMGLVPALEALFDECLRPAGVAVSFFTKDLPPRFQRDKELALYRIAQEAVHNVVKHARARQVHVNLVRRAGRLCLSLEDDGVGFDPSQVLDARPPRGLGLILMRERVLQLGGEFTLDSRPGGGTHLAVEVPL